jgi:hypothetical protein
MGNITGIPEGADMSGYTYLKDNIWMLLLSLGGVYIVSSFGEQELILLTPTQLRTLIKEVLDK